MENTMAITEMIPKNKVRSKRDKRFGLSLSLVICGEIRVDVFQKYNNNGINNPPIVFAPGQNVRPSPPVCGHRFPR